jgi:cell fate regulator YaaT (PSP1 superfamily)
MQKVIGVTYQRLGKEYYYAQENKVVSAGDKVVVDSEGSTMLATVVVANKFIDENELDTPLKPIIRLASSEDIKKAISNREKAKEAAIITTQKVREFALDMKIVDAMYSLDASKVIIDFTAEDRVDFRELLKALAVALKSRIELRQIGQRDEVKIKGGVGPCGQECCCKRFLKDFEHVTVKMAKNQGLSLSPTKISGLCGRLMCCLAYENPAYEDVLRRMPKVNSTVVTPEGKGVVVYNDLLRELVSVRTSAPDEVANIVVYPLENIEFEGKISASKDTEISESNASVEQKNNIKQENKPKVNKDNNPKQNKNNFGKNKEPKLSGAQTQEVVLGEEAKPKNAPNKPKYEVPNRVKVEGISVAENSNVALSAGEKPKNNGRKYHNKWHGKNNRNKKENNNGIQNQSK